MNISGALRSSIDKSYLFIIAHTILNNIEKGRYQAYFSSQHISWKNLSSSLKVNVVRGSHRFSFSQYFRASLHRSHTLYESCIFLSNQKYLSLNSLKRTTALFPLLSFRRLWKYREILFQIFWWKILDLLSPFLTVQSDITISDILWFTQNLIPCPRSSKQRSFSSTIIHSSTKLGFSDGLVILGWLLSNSLCDFLRRSLNDIDFSKSFFFSTLNFSQISSLFAFQWSNSILLSTILRTMVEWCRVISLTRLMMFQYLSLLSLRSYSSSIIKQLIFITLQGLLSHGFKSETGLLQIDIKDNMGSFFSNILGKLVGKKEIKILIVGLDNSGKTTILNKLHLNDVVQTAPTVGFNMETVKYKNLNFQVWDLGGQKSIRKYWEMYYPNTSAILYVVDSLDRERFPIAHEELKRLIENDNLKSVPVIVLANKQDVKQAASETQISELLKLVEIKDREWTIFKCSALTGTGLGESMDWLVTKLSK